MTIRVYLTDGLENCFKGAKSVTNTSDFLRIVDSSGTEQIYSNDDISLLVVTDCDIFTV